MRRLLLTLNLLFALASSAFAIEAVTVVGPVKVTFSTNTVTLSDGLWTSYSPNIGYMLGKVGVGTSVPSKTLDVTGTLNVTSGTSSFEIGTNDPYGMPQIWNKDTNAVLRLGSSQVDGDGTGNNKDAKGVVVYEPSNDMYSRMSGSMFCLRNLSIATPFWHVASTYSIYAQGTGGLGKVVYYADRTNQRFGVGLSTPAYLLHVASAAGTSGTFFAVSTGSTDLFRVLGSSINIQVPLVFPDGSSQSVAATSGVSIASITASSNSWSAVQNFPGKVGIGTSNTTAVYKLEVYSTNSGVAILQANNSNADVQENATGNVQLNLNSNRDGGTNQYSAVLLRHNNGVVGQILSDNSDDTLNIDASGPSLTKSGISINGSHNIGIGTSAPGISGAKLSIVGPVKIATTTTSSFSYTLTGSTNTGSQTNTLGTNGPNSVLTVPYTWLQILIGTVTAYIPAFQ